MRSDRAETSGDWGLSTLVKILGDDIGWFNIGLDHRGRMAGKTPNLDRLAAHGMMFV